MPANFTNRISTRKSASDVPSAAAQPAVVVAKTPLANRRSLTPGIGVLLVALLAMIAVQLFRLGHSRWPLGLIADVAIFTALPWVVFIVLSVVLKTKSGFSFTKANTIGFQLGAIGIAIAVVLWHVAIRPFGFGDANEVVALVAVQSVGWYLAVFSKVPGFEKASSILNGAVVFFVCCIADDVQVFVVAAMFAFVGLWWLLGQYWSRLESKAIDGDSKSLKLHGSAVSITMLVVALVACVAAAVPLSQNGISVAGFMPFSGGENGGQSEFALSGIGDGDRLTAGNNATTTGAVDSDEFIEDHKPSLYDITSERYDGPVVKRPRNRTVALQAMAKHMHEVKQSEQAGRSFRTMRNSDETSDLKLEDRITKALFYVEGSVPARFAINQFCQFDGWDWSNECEGPQPVRPKIALRKQNGFPVFKLAQSTASYLTGRRMHHAKIMRLDSKAIPSPALLQQWHIPQVDKLDFFRWGDSGLIELDFGSIPTHSLINVQSHVPNYHLLRKYDGFPKPKPFAPNDSDANETGTHGDSRNDVHVKRSRFLQVPDSVSSPQIQKLAARWTEGIKPGWLQVESIVGHLRSDFDLNPNWETDTQADDSVDLFLQQRGGPSYMCATTCALCLRSAGYKTRLASGFLVQKDDYDSRARQSIVTAQNLHMWPEVCLDGKFWIPVEPTPGYPIPYSTQTVFQWVTAQAVMTWNWLWSHPLTVVIFVSSLAIAIVFRAEWITSLMFGWWYLVRIFWPQGLLKTTRQLIDLRFWFSGNRRPASQTISAWYTRVEANATTTFCRLWNAENYSEKTARVSSQDLILTCRQTLDELSLKRIRRSAQENTA